MLAILLSVIGIGLAHTTGFYLSFQYSFEQYLGVHTLLELAAVFISFTVFGIVWFLRDGLDDYQGKFILFLGINFLTVGILDLFHTLSYEGMPEIITPGSAQKAALFWLFARYYSALVLCAAFLCKKFLTADNTRGTPGIYLILNIAASLLLSLLVIFYPNMLSPLVYPNWGLSLRGGGLELILILLFGAALIRLWRNHNGISETVVVNLGYFLILSIFADLLACLYPNLRDIHNVTAHLLKLGAFYFLFRAVYCSGVINNLYTLGEMAKMSAELLKQNISLEPVMDIQMSKLRKIIPHAQRIVVYIAEGKGMYRSNYVWGRFSDQLPAGRHFRLGPTGDKLGIKSTILENPMDFLAMFKLEGQSNNIPIELPLMLKEAKHLMFIPLVSNDMTFGLIVIYSFGVIHKFDADDLEKAQVFQRFATLAITQAKNQEIIDKLSYEDMLTDLPNRRLFFDKLQQIKELPGYAGEPYTIVFADMNGLKFINDTLGHGAGDQALKEIARLLALEAGKTGIAARLGGDEFAIVFYNMGRDAANVKAEELRQKFSAIKLPNYDVMFSLAVGAASAPEEGTDDEALMKLADDRMYEHKRKIKASGCGIQIIKQQPDENI